MAILVGLVPAAIIFISSLIGAWFSIRGAAIGYVAVLYVCLAYMIVMSFAMKPPPEILNMRGLLLDKMEEEVFRRHYLFFRFPFAAGNFTHFLNFARIFGIVWIIICVWQKFYVLAAMLVVFYAIAGWTMVRLYPIAHFKAAAEKGQRFAIKQLAHIEHILSKRDDLGF